MNTKYTSHLKSFILSPIFPILLGLMFFTLYIIYFTPVSLCDGTLDMKDKLDFEIWKLEENCIKINQTKFNLSNLDLVTSKNTNGGFIIRKVWSSQLEKFFNDEKILLNNINHIENYIKSIQPSFSTKLDAAWQHKWGIILTRN
jgi:hypothetical protein